eukprot:Hpha_TRINITY_DN15210_c1_g2::TRINITY_DN15210_c1_g2_i2::g.64606::m.64606
MPNPNPAMLLPTSNGSTDERLRRAERRGWQVCAVVCLAAVPMLWMQHHAWHHETAGRSEADVEEILALKRRNSAIREELDELRKRSGEMSRRVTTMAEELQAGRGSANAAEEIRESKDAEIRDLKQQNAELQRLRGKVAEDGEDTEKGAVPSQSGDWMKGVQAVLYSGEECDGDSFLLNMSRQQGPFMGCVDTCDETFSNGVRMHKDGVGPVVHSVKVRGVGFLRWLPSCAATYHYPESKADLAKARRVRESNGCVKVRDQSHFRLTIDGRALPGGSLEALRAAVKSLDPPKPSEQALEVEVGTDPDSFASRFHKRDWLPQIKRGDLLKNYTERFRTLEFESGERTQTCGDTEADELNAKGVALVRAHITYASYPRKVEKVEEAESFFEKAIEKAPGCVAPLLNLGIVLASRLPETNLEPGWKWVKEAVLAEPDNAKAQLWMGIYAEADGWGRVEGGRPGGSESLGQATQSYFQAFKIDSTLPLRYFGRPHKSWGTRTVPHEPRLMYDPNDVTERNYAAHELQRGGMRRLLLYKEFSEYYGAHGVVTREEAEGFIDRWSCKLPRLLPPYPLNVIRDVYGKMVTARYLRWQGADTKHWPENRFTHHNGPMARFTQAQILPRLSKIADRDLIPTYAYMGSYQGGGGIMPHLDREQCEWTLSLTLNTPESPHGASTVCPIGFATEPNRVGKYGNTDDPFPKNELPPEKNRVIFNSYPGDGAVIRGRAVVHWRPPSPGNCTQFFFHYVTSSFPDDLN